MQFFLALEALHDVMNVHFFKLLMIHVSTKLINCFKISNINCYIDYLINESNLAN